MTHKYLELSKTIKQQYSVKYKLDRLFSEKESFLFIQYFLTSVFLLLFFVPFSSFYVAYFSFPSEFSNAFSHLDFFLNLDVLFKDGFEQSSDLFVKSFLGISIVTYFSYLFYLKKKIQKNTFVVIFFSFVFLLINFGIFVNFSNDKSFVELNFIFFVLLFVFAFCYFSHFDIIKRLKKIDKNGLSKGFQETFNKNFQQLHDELTETKRNIFENKDEMLLFYEMAKDPSTSEVDQDLIEILFLEYNSYQNDKNEINNKLNKFDQILKKHNKQININND